MLCCVLIWFVAVVRQALEEFSMEAPLPDDDKDNEELYDRKVLIAAVVAVDSPPSPTA